MTDKQEDKNTTVEDYSALIPKGDTYLENNQIVESIENWTSQKLGVRKYLSMVHVHLILQPQSSGSILMSLIFFYRTKRNNMINLVHAARLCCQKKLINS